MEKLSKGRAVGGLRVGMPARGVMNDGAQAAAAVLLYLPDKGLNALFAVEVTMQAGSTCRAQFVDFGMMLAVADEHPVAACQQAAGTVQANTLGRTGNEDGIFRDQGGS